MILCCFLSIRSILRQVKYAPGAHLYATSSKDGSFKVCITDRCNFCFDKGSGLKTYSVRTISTINPQTAAAHGTILLAYESCWRCSSCSLMISSLVKQSFSYWLAAYNAYLDASCFAWFEGCLSPWRSIMTVSFILPHLQSVKSEQHQSEEIWNWKNHERLASIRCQDRSVARLVRWSVVRIPLSWNVTSIEGSC